MRKLLTSEPPEKKDNAPTLIAVGLEQLFIIISLILIALCAITILALPARAESHNKITVSYKDLCVLAIIGEAEGESYQGKLALAYALLNRGTLQGVYGLRSSRVTGHLYSQKTYNEALRAYKWASTHRDKDITHGATAWEGTDFKTPYWSKDMRVTLTVGNQRFYKKG